MGINPWTLRCSLCSLRTPQRIGSVGKQSPRFRAPRKFSAGFFRSLSLRVSTRTYRVFLGLMKYWLCVRDGGATDANKFCLFFGCILSFGKDPAGLEQGSLVCLWIFSLSFLSFFSLTADVYSFCFASSAFSLDMPLQVMVGGAADATKLFLADAFCFFFWKAPRRT